MIRISKNHKIFSTLAIFGLMRFALLQQKTSNLQRTEDNISLKEILGCSDITPRQSYFGQRGNNWVLYNYFRAEYQFGCDKSITYTTHADWTYLDNLVPLLERWQGPLSISLYAPDSDFPNSVKRIQFLRECINTTIVKDLVTFHLIFDQDHHVPKEKYIGEPGKLPVDCDELLRNKNLTFGGKPTQTYKTANNLTYPINIARNVARESATTHFVFASDIELYTSPGLIENFLEMIKRNDSKFLQTPQPKVFVLPIFEVEANVTRLPNTKGELVHMIRNGSAVPFHHYTCPHCHRQPKHKEWRNSISLETSLDVFHVGKRYKPFEHWEPIFIGTKFDPIYDERLSWEGRSDKMTQGYILCVLDYQFLILDSAFLVHRPGIKKPKRGVKVKASPLISKQSKLISKKIFPELKIIYGTRSGCVM